MHIDALRVDAGHDVLDGAILACRVHGLEDEQQPPTVLGVKHILHGGQRLDAGGQRFLRARLVVGFQVEGISRLDVFKAEAGSVLHTEWLRELVRILEDSSHFFSFFRFLHSFFPFS